MTPKLRQRYLPVCKHRSGHARPSGGVRPHYFRREAGRLWILARRDLATLVVAIEHDHDRRRHTDAAHTPTKEAAIVAAI